MVNGCKIDYDQLPHQRQPPCQHQPSNKETEAISAEIEKLVGWCLKIFTRGRLISIHYLIWVALIHLNVITLLDPFWMWCITRGIWLSAARLPGKGNTTTDKASRIFHDHTEWKLDSNIYASTRQALETPSIDLFASRLNFQTKRCIVWHPDPGAFAIDAFSVDWGEHHSLCFSSL